MQVGGNYMINFRVCYLRMGDLLVGRSAWNLKDVVVVLAHLLEFITI